MGWKGWARPPSRPQAGPRSSPGMCWWPRGALRGQAGGRAGRPASSRRAGWGLGGESRRRLRERRGRAPKARPCSLPQCPPPLPVRPPGPHQREGVVGLSQLLRAVLLQHHHALQACAAAPGTALAVYQVRVAAAILTCHEQDVKHLHLGQGGGKSGGGRATVDTQGERGSRRAGPLTSHSLQ